MKSRAILCAVAVVGLAGPAAAQAIQKPALSVSANDGRFTGYSAALPVDFSTDTESANLTARVAGTIESPTYDLNLNLTQKPDEARIGARSLAVGASWNDREAQLRSSMSKAFGFGVLPRTNYVSVSMDMNASQVTAIPAQIPVARANVRSSLTLKGRSIGSIAVGGGTIGDEGVDVSFTRPFDIPAEFTISLRAADERIQDGRFTVKLVKANW